MISTRRTLFLFATIAALLALLVAPVTSLRAAAEKLPAFVTVVSPIFGQLVAFSQPSNFVLGFENADGSNYIREVVPRGESVEKWTQMITVTGAKELAQQREVYPVAVASTIANGYKKFCPKSFAATVLPPPDVAGEDSARSCQPARPVTVWCSSVPTHAATSVSRPTARTTGLPPEVVARTVTGSPPSSRTPGSVTTTADDAEAVATSTSSARQTVAEATPRPMTARPTTPTPAVITRSSTQNPPRTDTPG